MTIFEELDQARGGNMRNAGREIAEIYHRVTRRMMEEKQARCCETCGADREIIFQGMMEGYESDNAQYSIKIIKNCKECEKAYIKHLDELCELIP